MKSGNLNFLECSGPLGACNGSDLPLYYSDEDCYNNRYVGGIICFSGGSRDDSQHILRRHLYFALIRNVIIKYSVLFLK